MSYPVVVPLESMIQCIASGGVAKGWADHIFPSITLDCPCSLSMMSKTPEMSDLTQGPMYKKAPQKKLQLHAELCLASRDVREQQNAHNVSGQPTRLPSKMEASACIQQA